MTVARSIQLAEIGKVASSQPKRSLEQQRRNVHNYSTQLLLSKERQLSVLSDGGLDNRKRQVDDESVISP